MGIIKPFRIKSFKNKNPIIEFENISLSYGNRLILDNINDSLNVDSAGYDGPDAWKNNDGTEFVAGANDIIEWDGSKWHIVFDASEDDSTVVFTTNLTTNKQYKYEDNEWILSYDGEYSVSTWYLNF